MRCLKKNDDDVLIINLHSFVSSILSNPLDLTGEYSLAIIYSFSKVSWFFRLLFRAKMRVIVDKAMNIALANS